MAKTPVESDDKGLPQGTPWWATWLLKQGTTIVLLIAGICGYAYWIAIPESLSRRKLLETTESNIIQQAGTTVEIKAYVGELREVVKTQLVANTQAATKAAVDAATAAQATHDSSRIIERGVAKVAELGERQGNWQTAWQAEVQQWHKEMQGEHKVMLETAKKIQERLECPPSLPMPAAKPGSSGG